MTADGSSRPLDDAERAELERYRAFLPQLTALCERVAHGDLEARLLGIELDAGELGRAAHGLNKLLDITDAGAELDLNVVDRPLDWSVEGAATN
jgi:hypothetical protein